MRDDDVSPYKVLSLCIENLFDISVLKPLNWPDMVVRNARNMLAAMERINPPTHVVCDEDDGYND